MTTATQQKSTIQNLINTLSKNEDVKKLVSRFNKLALELKSKQKELNIEINKQTEARVAQALDRYQDLVKTVNTAEAKLESEFSNALKKLKKSAHEVEKNLYQYKKKALSQKAEIEKILFKTKKAKKNTKTGNSKKASVTKKRSTKKSIKKAS